MQNISCSMFSSYIAQVHFSLNEEFQDDLADGVAFGCIKDDIPSIITAAHVPLSKIPYSYFVNNEITIYVKFSNPTGTVITKSLVKLSIGVCGQNIADCCIDLAVIIPENQVPITNYFQVYAAQNDDDVIGFGYTNGFISYLHGKIQSYPPRPCFDKTNSILSQRFLVNHNSRHGNSGGPYIKQKDDAFFVVGSLIGLIENSASVNALQSILDPI